MRAEIGDDDDDEKLKNIHCFAFFSAANENMIWSRFTERKKRWLLNNRIVYINLIKNKHNIVKSLKFEQNREKNI